MATDANVQIGRLGSLGIAIETSPGSANTTAAVYLPFTENSMRGHHTPLQDISARSSRIQDSNSVLGKRWAEGSVKINADVKNSGYLWKLALGNELYVAGTPSNHTFYPTVSGNAPLTATLINTRGGTDIEQYTYACINELSFEMAEGLGVMTASFQAQYPTNGTTQTVTTTSGTVFAFKDYFIQFGTTLTTAGAAATTPLTSFTLTIANNLEVIHRSGLSDVSAIRSKQLKVSGNYKMFFDSITDRDAYYALQKRSMIVTASGITNEQLRIRIPEFRLNEEEIASGLDNFYVLTANFVAEDQVDSGARLIDVRLQNDKTSSY
jgi:hypothetical protein